MTRCGCALALGALPRSFLSGQLDNIISKLVIASKMTSKQAPFVLSRRDCLKALTWYCSPTVENFVTTFLQILVELHCKTNASDWWWTTLWSHAYWPTLLVMAFNILFTCHTWQWKHSQNSQYVSSNVIEEEILQLQCSSVRRYVKEIDAEWQYFFVTVCYGK